MSGSQGAKDFVDSNAQLAPAPPNYTPGISAGQASQPLQAMAVTAAPGAAAQPASRIAPEPVDMQIPLSREDRRKVRLEERRRKRAALAAYDGQPAIQEMNSPTLLHLVKATTATWLRPDFDLKLDKLMGGRTNT